MKFKSLFILLLIILSGIFTPPQAKATTPLSNLSFETNDTWVNLSQDAGQHHTGAFSALGYGIPLFYQNCSVQSNGVTVLSFWAKGTGSLTDAIVIHYTDGTETSVGWVHDAGWTQYDVTASIDAGKTINSIGFVSGSNQPYYADDVVLTYTPPPTVVNGYLNDPDSGVGFVNNVYSMYRYYDFYVEVTTTANPCDVTDLYLTAQSGTNVRFQIEGLTLDAVPAWSVVKNDTQVILASNCTWTINGATGIAHIWVQTKWNFASQSGLKVWVEAVDSAGSSGNVNPNPALDFDVISDLVGTIDTANVNIFLGTQAEVHGGIFYELDPADTTIYGNQFYQPPDLQFTRVEIWNNTQIIALDNGIVNGNYSVIFIPNLLLDINQTYHSILYMASPYVNGLPPANNLTVTLYLTANWVPDLNLLTPLQKVFDLFGVTGGVVAVWDFLEIFGGTSAWFVKSVTMMTSYVTSTATMFFNFSVFFFSWILNMTNFIIAITSLIINILGGVSTAITYGGNTVGSISTGLGSVWTLFGGTNLVLFLPFVIFIMWIQSLDSREKTMGVNFISLAINDFQTVYGLINILTGFAIFIYSIVSDWIRWIFGFMSGFFQTLGDIV